jgi:hypothetical protein
MLTGSLVATNEIDFCPDSINFFLHALPLRSTHRDKCRRRCLSPAATLALAVNEADTTYTHAQYAMLLSEISCCCRRNVTSAG